MSASDPWRRRIGVEDLDSRLMQAVSDGDEDAFKELFERNYTRAVNTSYRVLGNRDAAEDAAMEAFVRIYEARSRYKPSARFTTFLYRVVANVSLNAASKRRVTTTLDPEVMQAIEDPGPDPSAQLESSEKSQAVRKAVLALPPNQRLAVALTKYECLSYELAAEAMGLSVGAFESLLHRAKENLRKALRVYL